MLTIKNKVMTKNLRYWTKKSISIDFFTWYNLFNKEEEES